MQSNPKDRARTIRPHAAHEGDVLRQAGRSEAKKQLSEILPVIAEVARRADNPLHMAVFRRLIDLDDQRLALVEQFMQQVIELNDPDAVATFLNWKEHPVLDTLLLLASRLSEDGQYELLETAEQLAGGSH